MVRESLRRVIIEDMQKDVAKFNGMHHDERITLREYMAEHKCCTYHSDTLNESYLVCEDILGNFYFESKEEHNEIIKGRS
jgi:hypothetical protein